MNDPNVPDGFEVLLVEYMSGHRNSYLKAGEYLGDFSQKQHLSSIIVSESVYRNEASHPAHSHELAFFTFVVRGNYFEDLCGKEHSFEPMTVLWRAGGCSHKDKIGNKGGRFFFVEIKPRLLAEMQQYKSPPERHINKNGSLAWLSTRVRREIQNWESSSPLIVEGIALEMLGYLLEAGRTPEKQPPKWLVRVTEKLNAEFRDNIRISKLSNEAGVHSVHLARVFRMFNNQSIGEYIHEKRIKYATSLLADRDVPIVDVAFAAGFSDQSHFTRIFKRHTGFTPAVFRKSLY